LLALSFMVAEGNAVLNEDLIKEMSGLGVFYGHKRTKTNPRMRPYIGVTKNEIEFIEPEATLKSLDEAIGFMKEKIENGGFPLLVGTMPMAKGAILDFAKEFNWPYVINRWLGGTLTNFKVISQRLAYYQELKANKESGEFGKYTKKEQHLFTEKINKLSKFFDGLVNLKRLPDFLFIVDTELHGTAVREARRLNVPIVAILDTDDDPTFVNYPIFANDHAKSSVDWVIQRIKKSLANVKIKEPQ